MDTDSTLHESFAWIELARSGRACDPQRALLFDLDRARILPVDHVAAVRRYHEEWGPFPDATREEIRMHATVVARKCGGSVEDIAALLAQAVQDGRLPAGRKMTTGGPPLAAVLAYLQRRPPSEWRGTVSAIYRLSYSFMPSEDALLMTLLNFQVEQRSRGASR